MNDDFDPYYVWLGIPPAEQPPHFYRLLAIELFEQNPDAIAAAADQRMLHLRAQQLGCHAAQSQRLLGEIAAARVCLLDPEKKVTYDELLRNRLEAEASASTYSEVSDSVASGLVRLFRRTTQDTSPVESRTIAMKRRAMLMHAIGPVLTGVVLLVLFARSGGWHTDALVVFDTADVRHPGTAITINGQPIAVPSSGPVKYRCCPGTIHIVATRPGFTPLKQTVTVDGGSKTAVQMVWERLPSPPPPTKDVSVKPKQETPAVSKKADVVAEVKNPSEAVVRQRLHNFAELISTDDTSGSPEESSRSETSSGPVSRANLPKFPAPSVAKRRKIAEKMAEAYDFAGAATPKDKRELARRLLHDGRGSTAHPDEQFALLEKAMELAGESGDVALMLQAVDAIGNRFSVDVLGVKGHALVRFSQKAASSDSIGEFVRGSGDVIGDAVLQQRHELALNLATVAVRLCQRSQGRAFRKEVHDRRMQLLKLCEQQRQIQQAREAVDATPEDSKLRLSLGLLLCFTQGDWKQGLPHLAKGSDDQLRKLAERELKASSVDAEEQIALADAWWQLAQTRAGEERDKLMLHAGHWYNRAQANVSSALTRRKVENRLAEIAKLERPASGGPREGARPTKTPSLGIWTDVL